MAVTIRQIGPLGLALVLAAGCAEDAEIEPVTITSIGIEGGTAVSHDGLMAITFSRGAVRTPTEISIRPVTTELVPPGLASDVYRVLPNALVFEGPVEVTISISNTGSNWGIVDVSGPTPIQLSGTRFDTTSGAAVASIFQLASYAVMAVDPFCGEDAACGNGGPPGDTFCDGGCVGVDLPLACDGGCVGIDLPLACDSGQCDGHDQPFLCDGGVCDALDGGGVICGDDAAACPFIDAGAVDAAGLPDI